MFSRIVFICFCFAPPGVQSPSVFLFCLLTPPFPLQACFPSPSPSLATHLLILVLQPHSLFRLLLTLSCLLRRFAGVAHFLNCVKSSLLARLHFFEASAEQLVDLQAEWDGRARVLWQLAHSHSCQSQLTSKTGSSTLLLDWRSDRHNLKCQT